MPTRMPVVNGIGEAARVLDRAQPHRRHLVGRAEVRTAPFATGASSDVSSMIPIEALTCFRRAISSQRHHAGVEVRQEPGLLDHPDRDRAHVVERGRVAARRQPLAGDRVAVLGPVAQGEQRLLAALPPAGLGDRDDLLRREEGRVELGRRLGERAVVAVVAAEHGERDEDLARIGDDLAVAEVAQAGRRSP